MDDEEVHRRYGVTTILETMIEQQDDEEKMNERNFHFEILLGDNVSDE